MGTLVDLKSYNPDDFVTGDEVMAADDISFVEVEVPEWGKKADGSSKKVLLKSMSGGEAITFGDKMNDPKTKSQGMIEIVTLTAVRPDGKGGYSPLFNQTQAVGLKKKSVRVFMRLQKAALELNGFNEKGEAKVKADSGEEASGDSPTA
jgi:hypothetical protein